MRDTLDPVSTSALISLPPSRTLAVIENLKLIGLIIPDVIFTGCSSGRTNWVPMENAVSCAYNGAINVRSTLLPVTAPITDRFLEQNGLEERSLLGSHLRSSSFPDTWIVPERFFVVDLQGICCMYTLVEVSL